MEWNLRAAYQLYLNSLNNSPLRKFDEWPKQNYYFTSKQKVSLSSSSSFKRERAVSSPTYSKIPGTSIETRGTQENKSTQADTNELSAPEKKKKTLVRITKKDSSLSVKRKFRDLKLENNI